MTYRTWQLSVVKSWWITWLLPTSANVPRRLDACVTVAVPGGPRWKATWRAPVRGFQQVTYHQHPVMSLNRFGVGWRSVLNKILFWFGHFWKGTLMSEKKTTEGGGKGGGAKHIPYSYPKNTHISLWDKISFINASKPKKIPTVRISAIQAWMNPTTIRFHTERLRSQESPGLRSSIRVAGCVNIPRWAKAEPNSCATYSRKAEAHRFSSVWGRCSRNIPSREPSQPSPYEKGPFWRWFSFSQGGIY